jgi:nifR3 family TIM-barrel protein
MIREITDKKIWVAPLAGITDKAYREICKRKGADVIMSEMVSADGLVFSREKSLEYAYFNETQRPFGIQIFGNDPDIMAKGAEIALSENPDFIDINMGCPVKKVVKRGAGSALMKTPELAIRIVKSVKKVLAGTEIPLSVKFRSGWDLESVNYLEYGRMMEDAGADLLILHPRTRSQMFSGHSNWTHIKILKAQSNIPVIGNGDIRNALDAKNMIEQTECDSIMIGRGIIGNPWIFQEIKDFWSGKEKTDITAEEKFSTIKEHLTLAIENKGLRKALPEMS